MSIDYSQFKFSKGKGIAKVEKELKTKPRANKGNKRVTVDKQVYEQVKEICKGHCQFGNCLKRNIELHHIVYRSESKDLINDISNCIMLCQEHHLLVHKNKHKYQKIMKERRNKL